MARHLPSLSAAQIRPRACARRRRTASRSRRRRCRQAENAARNCDRADRRSSWPRTPRPGSASGSSHSPPSALSQSSPVSGTSSQCPVRSPAGRDRLLSGLRKGGFVLYVPNRPHPRLARKALRVRCRRVPPLGHALGAEVTRLFLDHRLEGWNGSAVARMTIGRGAAAADVQREAREWAPLRQGVMFGDSAHGRTSAESSLR
jgi:hypothetical protein